MSSWSVLVSFGQLVHFSQILMPSTWSLCLGLLLLLSYSYSSFANDSCTSTIDDMSSTANNKYKQDGQEAKEIAQYLPYFPFKGIPRFYDIGGFLYQPAVFQKIVDIFAERYAELKVDVICGLDARGFILGPPIALALKKPFVMMRKSGKMPNTITSKDYSTEYGKRSGLTVQKDKIQTGMRVLIIDDLVATGGTLSSAISLVKMLKATVVECACVVELKMFIDPPADSGLPSRTGMFKKMGHIDVPIWGLISEDILTNEAKLPEGYVDDGEEH
jgi:adenine phosphoribosyltransferase